MLKLNSQLKFLFWWSLIDTSDCNMRIFSSILTSLFIKLIASSQCRKCFCRNICTSSWSRISTSLYLACWIQYWHAYWNADERRSLIVIWSISHRSLSEYSSLHKFSCRPSGQDSNCKHFESSMRCVAWSLTSNGFNWSWSLNKNSLNDRWRVQIDVFESVKIRSTECNDRRRSTIVSAEIFRRIIRDCMKSGSTSKTIDSTIMRNSWCSFFLSCEFFNRAENWVRTDRYVCVICSDLSMLENCKIVSSRSWEFQSKSSTKRDMIIAITNKETVMSIKAWSLLSLNQSRSKNVLDKEFRL